MFHTKHCCAGFIMDAKKILSVSNESCIPQSEKGNRKIRLGISVVLFYFPTKSNFMNKWFSFCEFHGLTVFSAGIIFLSVEIDTIINLLNI